MDNRKIVDNIRLLCEENNISVSQLERALFMSPGLISRWVKNMPTLDRILDVASYFSVPVEAIVGSISKADESSRNISRLLPILYNKSVNVEIEWVVLNPACPPTEWNDTVMPCIITNSQQDAFYCSVHEGYFVFVIDYTDSEEMKLLLYVLPSSHSTPELRCSDTRKLTPLYTYLSRRLQKQLNSIKTDNFINQFIDSYTLSDPAQNDDKITLLTSNTTAANQ